MSKQAYFIGGSFDMTKRILNVRSFDEVVKFYEPPRETRISSNNVNEAIECEVVEYRLQALTQGGVGVYEFVGVSR